METGGVSAGVEGQKDNLAGWGGPFHAQIQDGKESLSRAVAVPSSQFTPGEKYQGGNLCPPPTYTFLDSRVPTLLQGRQ